MKNKKTPIKITIILLAVLCWCFCARADDLITQTPRERQDIAEKVFDVEGAHDGIEDMLRDALEFNPHIWEEIDGLEVIEDGESTRFKRYGVAIEDLDDYEMNQLHGEIHHIILNEQLEAIRMITEQQRHLRDIQNVQRTLQQIRSTGHQVPARAPQQPPRPPQQPPRPPQR